MPNWILNAWRLLKPTQISKGRTSGPLVEDCCKNTDLWSKRAVWTSFSIQCLSDVWNFSTSYILSGVSFAYSPYFWCSLGLFIWLAHRAPHTLQHCSACVVFHNLFRQLSIHVILVDGLSIQYCANYQPLNASKYPPSASQRLDQLIACTPLFCNTKRQGKR